MIEEVLVLATAGFCFFVVFVGFVCAPLLREARADETGKR